MPFFKFGEIAKNDYVCIIFEIWMLMAEYRSKYRGEEVDALLDKIAESNVGDIDSALSLESENPVMNKVITEELNKKVNRTSIATINGQTLTDGGNIEVSTDAYDDTEIKGKLTELQSKVGEKAKVTPILTSGTQIATITTENAEGQEVGTPLYAPNGGGGANFDKLWESFGCVKNIDGTWTLGYITDLTEAELWEIYKLPVLSPNSNQIYTDYHTITKTNFAKLANYLSTCDYGMRSAKFTQFYVAPKDKSVNLGNPAGPQSVAFTYLIYASDVRYICGILDLSFVAQMSARNFQNGFLEEFRLKNLKFTIDLYGNIGPFGAQISAESIHYMIANASNTSPITITLNPTAKARWEASEYYAEDSQTCVTKQIQIA